MFIKRDHYNDKMFFILMEIVAIFIVFIVISNIILECLIILSILLLGYLLYKKFCEFGIYVTNNDIIIKKLGRKKLISINDIKAVSIIKAVYRGKYSCIDLKDSLGQQLYTILLLNDCDYKMYNYKNGDFAFMMQFNKSIIGKCIYDDNFIDWLQNTNPQINIIDCREKQN